MGGAGKDRFLFSDPKNGADTMTDFVSETDKLGFDYSVVAGLMAGTQPVLSVRKPLHPGVAGLTLYARGANGALFWNADGVGGAAEIKLATLAGVTSATASDLYVF